MSSLTNNGDKTMASDAIAPRADEPDDRGPTPRADKTDTSGGFFTIYKKGQGYWTRMGTAGAAILLLLLTANFFYSQLRVIFDSLESRPQLRLGIAAGVLVAGALLFWRLMNGARNADFLIATDSEMKKVNWTSRNELIGSTKIVIAFMFIIAILLFAVDIGFGYFFWLIHVLKTKPF